MPPRKRKNALPATDKRPAKRDRRQWMTLAALLLFAVVLRVIYLIQYKADVPYYSGLIVDSEYYDEWAQGIAGGIGYGAKPFYLAPLYPYVLALIYMIAGHNLTAAYLVNAALGLANLALVYALARRIFGHASGVIAVGLLVLYAPLMYLEPKLLSEVLAITLSLSSILLLMRALGKGSVALFFVSGLALGLAAISRPIALAFILLIGIWLAIGRIRRNQILSGRRIAALTVGIVVPILIVTGRNWFVGGDFAPISTNAGVTFAQGNNEQTHGVCIVVLPGFTGAIKNQQQEETALASRALERDLKPSEASRYWLGQGLSFIKEHPGAYLRLLGSKVIWSLHNRESPCSYNFYAERRLVPVLRYLLLPFSLLMGLSVFGFVRARKVDRGVALLGLHVLSIFIGLLVFFVTSRYRIPAVPVLAIFAGFGVVKAYEDLRARQVLTLVMAILCVVPVMLLSLVPYPLPAITVESPINLGISYLMLGESDKAASQFREALRIRPGYGFAYRCLGDARAQAGKLSKAADEYRKVIELDPSDYLAHFGLGMMLSQQRKFDEAIGPFREAVRLNPSAEEGHNNLAVAYFTTGDYSSAWEEVHACIEQGGQPHPTFVRALSEMMPDPGRVAPLSRP